jgi:hypothetical protein
VFTIISFLILLIISVQAQSTRVCSDQSNREADSFMNSVNPYPNELEGFRFFGEGKLNALRHGISTSDDVEKIFGPPLEVNWHSKTYKYDSNWLVQVSFFFRLPAETELNTLQKARKGVKLYVPLPEYIGKIESIKMYPKSSAAFPQTVSLEKFVAVSKYDGQDSKTKSLELRAYYDGEALVYWVNYINSDPNGSFKYITYALPNSVYCKVYDEQIQ